MEQLREYPTDRIACIAADEGTAERVVGAVHGVDGAPRELEVLRPRQHEEVTTDGDAVEGVVAGLRKLFGEETPHLERYAAALEQGATVVLAPMPDADEVGEEAHERVKRAVGDAMVAAGAADATFFGRWSVEQLGHST